MINNDDVATRLGYKYNYLNLDTHFSCSGTVNKEDFSRSSCFARALKRGYINMDNTYEIKTFKRYSDRFSDYDNLCMFSEEEMNTYLGYLNEIYEFEYSIVNNESYYIIKIHINDSHFIHTFILTAIRYLYERQYAIPLNEAMMLKKTFLFRNMNILSLMCLVLDSNPEVFRQASDDMSHFIVGEYKTYLDIMSTEELKDRINKFKDDYQDSEYNGKKTRRFRRITGLFNHILRSSVALEDVGISVTNYGDIAFNDSFHERFVAYRNNFFALKNAHVLNEGELHQELSSYYRKDYTSDYWV